jgi:hypothetical protein
MNRTIEFGTRNSETSASPSTGSGRGSVEPCGMGMPLERCRQLPDRLKCAPVRAESPPITQTTGCTRGYSCSSSSRPIRCKSLIFHLAEFRHAQRIYLQWVVFETIISLQVLEIPQVANVIEFFRNRPAQVVDFKRLMNKIILSLQVLEIPPVTNIFNDFPPVSSLIFRSLRRNPG